MTVGRARGDEPFQVHGRSRLRSLEAYGFRDKCFLSEGILRFMRFDNLMAEPIRYEKDE